MYVFKIFTRRIFITTLSLLTILLLSGCSQTAYNENPTEPENISFRDNERLFIFRVENDPDSGVTSYSAKDLNGNFNHGLEYRNVSNININVDDMMIPLADALRDNAISETDILCYALQDAQHGICELSCESYQGLNHFTFIYPECDIRIIYDVLETPNGDQHFISQLVFYDSDECLLSPSMNFYDEATGELLVQEDWGLSLEITQVTSTGMTIACSQSGGMQIGQLNATSYFLTNEDSTIQRLDNTSGAMPEINTSLEMDGSTSLILEWSDIYGEIPTGTYTIGIAIEDIYDRENVHPLMRNYRDWQNYYLTFTIP